MDFRHFPLADAVEAVDQQVSMIVFAERELQGSSDAPVCFCGDEPDDEDAVLDSKPGHRTEGQRGCQGDEGHPEQPLEQEQCAGQQPDVEAEPFLQVLIGGGDTKSAVEGQQQVDDQWRGDQDGQRPDDHHTVALEDLGGPGPGNALG